MPLDDEVDDAKAAAAAQADSCYSQYDKKMPMPPDYYDYMYEQSETELPGIEPPPLDKPPSTEHSDDAHDNIHM